MTITSKNQTKKLKQEIIKRFLANVKGKKSDTTKANTKHSGKEGHWLELQMGLQPNSNNKPDLYGFEMKNGTTSKTTFGDWSANHYIFNDPIYGMDRDMFLKLFGKANLNKNGRYSWSGEPCPKINKYNSFGQILVVDKEENIVIFYDYKKDKRTNKNSFIPENIKNNKVILAKWDKISIKKKVENKFNNKGWFQCIKNSEGVYINIVFGEPINFSNWINGVKEGQIFFDSGMYQGNKRPYSEWRANNSYWDSLQTSKY